MDILCFGQQNWDVCWTGKQQLMSRLVRRGHRVLYIDPVPDKAGGLRRFGPKLWIYTHRPLPLIGWRLNRRAWVIAPALAARSLGFRAPLALSLHPDFLSQIEALDPTGLVYYAVDEQTAYGGQSEAYRRAVRERENRLLARCEVALAVSPRLVSRFRERQPDSHLLENGADVEHFSPLRLARVRTHPALAGMAGPILGFIGQVDDRLDQDLLRAIAAARPDWQIVLAGRLKQGVDLSRLAAANIHLLGHQPYDDLPAIGRAVDLWLVPYRETELTQSCNPLKIFEYLATGLPVVATPLEGIGICRSAVTLAAGGDVAAWLGAIERHLRAPEQGRRERLALAAANSWEARVEALDAHLHRAADKAARQAGTALARRRAVPARRARAVTPLPERTGRHGLLFPRRLGFGFRVPLVAAARGAGLARHGLRALKGRLRGEAGAQPRRILVIWHAALGDTVALLPALKALRRAYPDAHITLGVPPNMTAHHLPRAALAVDEVLALGFVWSGDRIAELRGMWRLFRRDFDLVVNGGGSFFMPEVYFTGAPRMISLYDGHPGSAPYGAALLTDRSIHQADNNLALVEALTGRPEPEEGRVPRLDLPEEEVAARGQAVRTALGLEEGVPLVLIHPGSTLASRRWPTERFAALATGLLSRRPELHVVLTGVPKEQELVSSILRAVPSTLLPRVHDSLGRTDLTGLIGLLAHARLLVSNDTGIMHLARARGTPLIALMGPEDDLLWGPHPHGPAPAVALRVEVPCAPCAVQSCASHFCMRSLSVEAVLAEAERLLDRGRANDGAYVARERLIERRSWTALAEDGFVLPPVSVILRLGPREAEARLESVLAALERQTYPALELVVLSRAQTMWRDRRDPAQQRALPVRMAVAIDESAVALWRAGLRESCGSLLIAAEGCEIWRPDSIGRNVAAALREPRAACFRDGAPLDARLGEADLAGMLVRREAAEALLGTLTSAPGPLRPRVVRRVRPSA